MTKKVLVSLLAVSYFVLSACGHKKVAYQSSPVEGAKKGLNADVKWLKNKRNMIDMKVVFNNNSAQLITVNETAITITFEGQKGVYKKEGKAIQVGANQSEERLLHFAFDPKIKAKGTAVFTLDPVESTDDKNKVRKDSVSLNLPID